MDVQLREIDGSALASFLDRSRAAYVEQSVAAGGDRAEAERSAAASLSAAFPGGLASDGHVVFDVVAEGDTSGWLWLGPRSADDPARWWVWDVEIDEQHRGRGLGRAVMELAEDAARTRGATTIGLNVFDDNPVAGRLYESLGYRTDEYTAHGRLMGKAL